VFEGLAELLFPTRCAGCDAPGAALCPRCLADVARIDRALACVRCGAPGGRDECATCADARYAFRATRCAGVLAGPLARAVVTYKDSGERRLALVLAGLAGDALVGWEGWAEAVTWVPASPAAVVRRGFDHAELLARCLAARLDTHPVRMLLCREGRDQRELGRDARRANAAGAFVARPGLAAPARVLLVDDVLTTGSTMDAAAARLREAGAVEVRAVAVARACGPLEAGHLLQSGVLPPGSVVAGVSPSPR